MKHKLYMLMLWHLPKSLAHKIYYKKCVGKNLNLKNPQNLNEKIQWLMVYQYGKKEGELADKEKVKAYISSKKIDGLSIPKTLKTYHDVSEINIQELPNQFVLKCNHGCGGVYICLDKSNFDFVSVKENLQKQLKKNYAKKNLEYHYAYIEPLIMAEEYIDDGLGKNPIDYKFFCFHGKVECILVCSNRDTQDYRDYYDKYWNYLEYAKIERRSPTKIEKPNHLETMVVCAEKIAADWSFVRVDMYLTHEKIYFGEMTFTPAAGMMNSVYDSALTDLGEKLIIDTDKKGEREL